MCPMQAMTTFPSSIPPATRWLRLFLLLGDPQILLPLVRTGRLSTYPASTGSFRAGAFSLVTTGVVGANIASVDPVSGSNDKQYTVAVNTGIGSGTVELDVSGAGIHDLAGNVLPGGTFQPQTTWLTGSLPRTVALGDTNGDGKQDL